MTILDANLKFNSNYEIRTGNPGGFVLHHAAANGSVEDVHAWHLARGWAGIGYHFYVRKDGTVYRGRPENWYGAHTSGHNEKLGICAEGNFENENMPKAQKDAITALLQYLQEQYGDLQVYGHRDLDATACPGRNYPFDSIVEGSQEEAPTPEADPNAVTVTLTTLGLNDEGQQVKALQSLLLGAGLDLGIYGADGIFGPVTDRAVRAYQQNNRLAVDGLVGINTWRSLLGAA